MGPRRRRCYPEVEGRRGSESRWSVQVQGPVGPGRPEGDIDDGSGGSGCAKWRAAKVGSLEHQWSSIGEGTRTRRDLSIGTATTPVNGNDREESRKRDEELKQLRLECLENQAKILLHQSQGEIWKSDDPDDAWKAMVQEVAKSLDRVYNPPDFDDLTSPSSN